MHREYELSAMHLDEQHHGTVLGMVGGRLTPLTGPGPVQRIFGRQRNTGIEIRYNVTTFAT